MTLNSCEVQTISATKVKWDSDGTQLQHYFTNEHLHSKAPAFDHWKAAPVIPLALRLPTSGRMDFYDSAADARPGRHAHQLQEETQCDFGRAQIAEIFPEFQSKTAVLMLNT